MIGLMLCLPFCARAETRIVAQVNDDIVSERDLKNRIAMIKATGGATGKEAGFENAVLERLIDEALKRQEIERSGVKIDDAEIDRALDDLLRRNGTTRAAVSKKLEAAKVPFSVLRDQIKTDMMFVRAIRKTQARRIEPSDAEIETRLKEIAEKAKSVQYLLSEIVLPVEKEEDDPAVYGRAMKLLMRLRDGEPFDRLAEKNSVAPTASAGGMAGWIAKTDLPDEVAEELDLTEAGQLTSPVRVGGFYKIYALHAVRRPEDVVEQDGVRLTQLFIPSSFNAKKRKEILRDAAMTKGSCESFAALSARLRTTPAVDAGLVPLKELPPPFARALNGVKETMLTAPIRIDGGEVLLMPCSFEKISPFPSKEEIKEQLESRALETAADRRLRELRRASITEIRK